MFGTCIRFVRVAALSLLSVCVLPHLAGASGSLQFSSLFHPLPSFGVQEDQSRFASSGPETSKPFGWVDFCKRYKGECDTQPLPAQNVALNGKAWLEIQHVNNWVNENVEPVSDMAHWGVPDQWDYPNDGKGDCEDYALMKRKLLMEAGIPRQALLMTVVLDENRQGHALLMVRTSIGDLILDNKRPDVRLWSTAGYEYIKRQSQEDPNVWVTLRRTAPPSIATSSNSR